MLYFCDNYTNICIYSKDFKLLRRKYANKGKPELLYILYFFIRDLN